MILERLSRFFGYEYYRQVNAFVDWGRVSVGYGGTYIRNPIDIIEDGKDFKAKAFSVKQ